MRRRRVAEATPVPLPYFRRRTSSNSTGRIEIRDDAERYDGEMRLHERHVAPEDAGAQTEDHPGDRADEIVEHERRRRHLRGARHERHECPYDWHEPPQDDGFAAITLEKRVRPAQVVAVQQSMRDARRVRRVEDTRPDQPSDRVIDGVAGECGRGQQRKRQPAIQSAHRAHGAGGEQQRVAWKKRRDHQPCFSEDDREQQSVDPWTVGSNEIQEMGVEVKNEIEGGRHRADILSHPFRQIGPPTGSPSWPRL